MKIVWIEKQKPPYPTGAVYMAPVLVYTGRGDWQIALCSIRPIGCGRAYGNGRGDLPVAPTKWFIILFTLHMTFNSDLHKRLSIRLAGYDYSQAGLYFVTICTKDRQCLFGAIENGQMILNETGKIANDCWLAIPEHFPHAVLHEYIIMPNHVHGIVELTGDEKNTVGANNHSPLMGSGRAEYNPSLNETGAKDFSPLHAVEFKSPSKTIGSIVRGFKIGVTKWGRQHTNVYAIWQRNYYEHIIRTPASHEKIVDYIIHNPANWKDDSLYKN